MFGRILVKTQVSSQKRSAKTHTTDDTRESARARQHIKTRMRRAVRQCYHHHHHHSFLLDASVSSSEAVFAPRRPPPSSHHHRRHHHQFLRRFYGKHVVLEEYVKKEEDEQRVLLNKHVVVTGDSLEHENISDPNKVGESSSVLGEPSGRGSFARVFGQVSLSVALFFFLFLFLER